MWWLLSVFFYYDGSVKKNIEIISSAWGENYFFP